MANHLWDGLFGVHAENAAPLIRSANSSGWTYADYIDRCRRAAGGLIAQGIRPGDRVAAQIDKSPEVLVLYGACVAMGAVFLPLNTAYTAEEMRYFLTDAGPAVLICKQHMVEALQNTEATPHVPTLTTDGSGSLRSTILDHPNPSPPAARAPSDLAAILYTSGTTGHSKGAMLTHDNLLSNALTLVEHWAFTDRDILLHALPVFHAHGLFVAVNTVLASGASMLFLPAFSVDGVIAGLPAATTMMGVPTFYSRLLDDGRFDRALVANMRVFISGSAPLSSATHSAFERRTGHKILERYGMTETIMITSNPYDGPRKPGTVGMTLPGITTRICDSVTGEQVRPGEIGIIEVKGPNVFAGYWNMPEKTRDEFRSDGFFVTGDMARLDRDGYVEIVGRNKDLVISGGYNVYPKEIEQLLDAQHEIVESAVFGVPHPDFGEAVLAVVVPTENSSIDEQAIKAVLGGKLARYKLPKQIVSLPHLPRNALGKVQKNELRRLFWSTFAGPGSL